MKVKQVRNKKIKFGIQTGSTSASNMSRFNPSNPLRIQIHKDTGSLKKTIRVSAKGNKKHG